MKSPAPENLAYYHTPAIYTTIKCMGKTLVFMVYQNKNKKKEPNKNMEPCSKPCNIKHKSDITDNTAFAFSTNN